MSWMNRQLPLYITSRISSVAADAEQEVMLFESATNNIEILSARFTPDSNIVTDNDSAFGFYLVNEGTSGTLNTTVASFTATTTAATFSATQSIALTLSTASGATEIEAGEVLTWKETTIGTGTARANGVVTIEAVIL